jgi:hypothetical protein
MINLAGPSSKALLPSEALTKPVHLFQLLKHRYLSQFEEKADRTADHQTTSAVEAMCTKWSTFSDLLGNVKVLMRGWGRGRLGYHLLAACRDHIDG